MKKTCGDCRYFEPANPYRWGVCRCPMPIWLEEYNWPHIFPNNEQAEDCELFVAKP